MNINPLKFHPTTLLIQFVTTFTTLLGLSLITNWIESDLKGIFLLSLIYIFLYSFLMILFEIMLIHFLEATKLKIYIIFIVTIFNYLLDYAIFYGSLFIMKQINQLNFRHSILIYGIVCIISLIMKKIYPVGKGSKRWRKSQS